MVMQRMVAGGFRRFSRGADDEPIGALNNLGLGMGAGVAPGGL